MIAYMPRRTRTPINTPKPKAVNRLGSPLNAWINSELMQAFEAYCEETRRTKTAEIELAIEEKLRSVGFWPPKQPTA